jgi:hypothetical protein
MEKRKKKKKRKKKSLRFALLEGSCGLQLAAWRLCGGA